MKGFVIRIPKNKKLAIIDTTRCDIFGRVINTYSSQREATDCFKKELKNIIGPNKEFLVRISFIPNKYQEGDLINLIEAENIPRKD